MMKQIEDGTDKIFGNYPEKVLQFGEGNFLRAFAGWMIDLANESGLYHGSIVLCQPIEQGMADKLNSQDGIYTVMLRGIKNGKPTEEVRQITSVSRCINPYHDYDELLKLAESPDLEVIISNTTEAGIAYHVGDKLTDAPPTSFPAKLCAFLYHRYVTFRGAADKGMLILPVELIDQNGDNLKRIVLEYAQEWQLEERFIRWIDEANAFTNTLVDRIVTGYPHDTIHPIWKQLGYRDECLVTAELFNLWVIEGNEAWADRFPIHKTQANVLWTDNVTPYKKRKVRILNGSHTAVVPCAYLGGYDTVLEFFTDSVFGDFERELIRCEIIPAVDLPKDDLISFAAEVSNRFKNPYLKHYLYDITLNNCSKFCARCLPTIQDYYAKTGEIPLRLAFALAGFIRFYKVMKTDEGYIGYRDNGEHYIPRDDERVLEFFAAQWDSNTVRDVVEHTLANKSLWDNYDLTEIAGLKEAVTKYLTAILDDGMKSAVSTFMTTE